MNAFLDGFYVFGVAFLVFGWSRICFGAWRQRGGK